MQTNTMTSAARERQVTDDDCIPGTIRPAAHAAVEALRAAPLRTTTSGIVGRRLGITAHQAHELLADMAKLGLVVLARQHYVTRNTTWTLAVEGPHRRAARSA